MYANNLGLCGKYLLDLGYLCVNVCDLLIQYRKQPDVKSQRTQLGRTQTKKVNKVFGFFFFFAMDENYQIKPTMCILICGISNVAFWKTIPAVLLLYLMNFEMRVHTQCKQSILCASFTATTVRLLDSKLFFHQGHHCLSCHCLTHVAVDITHYPSMGEKFVFYVFFILFYWSLWHFSE